MEHREGHRLTLISQSWADELVSFVGQVRDEFLIASPWITSPVAQLVADALPPEGRLSIRIISRLDLSDFVSGASDLDAFAPETFMGKGSLAIRGLRNLHAKLYVADRREVIIGSGNLTEGGIRLNHELLVRIADPVFVDYARAAFERLWHIAAPTDSSYFSWIASELEHLALPAERPEMPKRDAGQPVRQFRQAPPLTIPYVQVAGAAAARAMLVERSRTIRAARSARASVAAEPDHMIIRWLEATRWVPRETREAPELLARIRRYLSHPSSEHIRATAIEMIGRLGLRSFVPDLRDVLSHSEHGVPMRAASALALALMGEAAAFGELLDIAQEEGHVGRWARRGCFMLLALVHEEQRSRLLATMGVPESLQLEELLTVLKPHTGTNSERLSKALLLERLLLGYWTDTDVDVLVYVQHLALSALQPKRKFAGYGEFVKEAARTLHIMPGDVHKSLLSINLLKRISESGWPEGLREVLGPRWLQITSMPTTFREALETRLSAETRQSLATLEAIVGAAQSKPWSASAEE